MLLGTPDEALLILHLTTPGRPGGTAYVEPDPNIFMLPCAYIITCEVVKR
jgi:hypothetical protein